ncbi:bifunctional phosphopantothenoylcysteine decarboxylase/phosphopantothenate--cysteine ligase CoaBC [Nitrosospira sp. Is2]|uniref:bifunctional phosphopantothenoylcysteine decarboxylase/phosphopantothenate--cysteine ligase CoaBC n=1 Tax=Nitrosospira sp. Is2 TaxID=3080532 RepID=UPI002954243D|nr:bifunctional phosphopantothenoylcysteine decarboxylase/phosphopantothenate--cysteine ligase CoaBC [Nitrosospira sp. Is2]WON74605.1 bifunctional phosphopantothenoylcysteine decarboxylase/phosphopantothenate--cysteine ligase CoaBC [Nitrosospira sp. Is2]
MTDTSLPRIRLILGLTGGVAAYKAAELARLLMHDGVDVQAVMTRSACHFVGTATLQALTGKPVLTELWDERLPNGMAHIDLSRNADAILIAPASADFIAKLAHGLADDLLSTLCLARDCPLLIAPAMNRQMWENAATQRNIDMLERDGLTILGPGSGPQACGETGIGRMLEAYELAESVRAFFEPRLLQGKRVLVTAGPTYEAIDAVRGIMNLSSGKMGYAIARAARDAGAEVILVSGPVCLQPPSALKFLSVTSAEDMVAVVKNEISQADIFVSVAAVADYRAIRVSGQKIKKTGSNITLELTPNQDILAYAAGLPHAPFCVGFAAETENLEENAEAKRRKKRLPLLVANLAQEAIGSEECELTLLDDSGRHFLPEAPKLVQARRLVKHIASMQKKNA